MNRLLSRKFLVWAMTNVFVAVTIFVTKTVPAELINMYGLISVIYIGGNSVKHYIDAKHGSTPENKPDFNGK